jgi:hypothetical protein
MTISILNTWAVGQTISCSDVTYTIGLIAINDVPVRCLIVPYTNIPCAIILHVLGHGDWIYFHRSAPSKEFPRILNNWQTYQGTTIKETQEVQQILISKLYYAIRIMKKIIAE